MRSNHYKVKVIHYLFYQNLLLFITITTLTGFSHIKLRNKYEIRF
jgi:hypothetical protein